MVKLQIVLLTTLIATSECCLANSETEAQKKLTQALIKQFKLDSYVKSLQKKYIPAYVSKHVGFAFGTYKVLDEGYVQFKWKF